MRQHRCDRPSRNQLLEMAALSMALYGSAGLGPCLHYLPGRTPPRVALSPPSITVEGCCSVCGAVYYLTLTNGVPYTWKLHAPSTSELFAPLTEVGVRGAE